MTPIKNNQASKSVTDSIINFTVQNEDLLKFLENKENKVSKFMINNQYICNLNGLK